MVTRRIPVFMAFGAKASGLIGSDSVEERSAPLD